MQKTWQDNMCLILSDSWSGESEKGAQQMQSFQAASREWYPGNTP